MERTISARRHGFLISLVLALSVQVFGQHTGEGLAGTFNTPGGGLITKTIVDRLTKPDRDQRPQTRRTPAVSGKPNEGPLLFHSTGTQLKTSEIANLIDAGNPQVMAIMTTILNEYEKGARAAGHPNDLALALSFFFATNASIYHDGGQPSDPAMIELRNTIAQALGEGNALSSMNDRQKQEMYETLILFTGFALAVYEEGKGGNAESLKVSQQLAGQNLLAVTGISPDKINFTNQGLSIERDPVSETATKSNTEPLISGAAPAATLSSSDFLDFDPFPDKPYVQPQQPLVGRLRKTITTADLAGTWEIGGASVTTYVSSGTIRNVDERILQLSAVAGARLDRHETYNAKFLAWHWRLGAEQLLYSHQTTDLTTHQPRYMSNQKAMLLACGLEDQVPYNEICPATQKTARLMTLTPGKALFLDKTGHSLDNERRMYWARQILDFLK